VAPHPQPGTHNCLFINISKKFKKKRKRGLFWQSYTPGGPPPVRIRCFYGLMADHQFLRGVGGGGRQPTEFAPGAINRRYATEVTYASVAIYSRIVCFCHISRGRTISTYVFAYVFREGKSNLSTKLHFLFFVTKA